MNPGRKRMQVTVASQPLNPGPTARLTWQIWLDGQVMWPPLPLADGLLIVVDHADSHHPSVVRRLDHDGRTLWERDLGGRACGAAVRTEGFVVVPVNGDALHVLDARTGRQVRSPLGLLGAQLVPPVAACSGRLWARFGPGPVADGRSLVCLDLSDPRAVPRILPDPFGPTTEVHFRRTNHTLVAAAEHPTGRPTLTGLDEPSGAPLWRVELDCANVSDLWATGGLVDVVCDDHVQSFEARSGANLTSRFEASPLEGARIAGEVLLVPGVDPRGRRQLRAFDCATEDARGRAVGVQRVIGASADLVLAEDDQGGALLLELPELTPIALPEADAIAAPSLVAFSRHHAWIVGHGGRTLSELDLP